MIRLLTHGTSGQSNWESVMRPRVSLLSSSCAKISQLGGGALRGAGWGVGAVQTLRLGPVLDR